MPHHNCPNFYFSYSKPNILIHNIMVLCASIRLIAQFRKMVYLKSSLVWFFSVTAGKSEVRVVHHQDLNKKIIIALIVASTVLGGILLFVSCFWIYRHKKLRDSNGKSQKKKGLYLLLHQFIYFH